MAKTPAWEYAGTNTIKVSTGTPKNPKKMTGTRLGKVLGLDSWGSEFQAWCEITRVAEPPFDGNKFTDAGNAIEPKLIAWCKENVSPYVYTPEEFYGVPDAKQAMRYDFFPKQPILGGMWDAIILDGPLGKGKPLGYVEAKTSSRPQDWVDGPPLKYCVQGLLYGHLDNLPRVFIPVRFMEQHEYDNPSACECTDSNTFLYDLSVEDTLINDMTIAQLVDKAMDWYGNHVSDNLSPAFDEKKDKEYLDILRKSEVQCDELELLAKDAAALEAKIEVAKSKAGIADLEKSLKTIKDKMKPAYIALFKDNDEVVTAYGWRVKRSEKETIDKEKLETDGLLEKYTTTTVSYTMSKEKSNG